jgi:hypothetical protein
VPTPPSAPKPNHLAYWDIPCPRCGSRRLRCRDTLVQLGHTWHDERVAKFAEACGCPDCTKWLQDVQ